MNSFPNYFECSTENFSNKAKGMSSYFPPGKSLDEINKEKEQGKSFNTAPWEHVSAISTIKSKQFSIVWTVDNFKGFMDRQYEFSSPIFSRNLSHNTISKWRMTLHPENIYPEGVHVALRLFIISEVDRSYSVMYTISIVDDNGKHHKLKTREKVFRRCLDFDECSVSSNINIKERKLLSDKSLIIKCEFDLLECENMEDIATCSALGNLKSSMNTACNSLMKESYEIPRGSNYQNDQNCTPSIIQRMNDLSYSEAYTKPSDKEKNVDCFIKNDTIGENKSGEFEIPKSKIKGLELLSDDLESLYYNTNQHDIVIVALDGKRTAHEIILTSRSGYFKNALMSQRCKEINIPGIKVDILDVVLHYLYTGKLKHITENFALDLLKASKFLDLPCLESMITETFLCSHIQASNVTNVFLMAKELKIESLKNNALKFIAENCDEVTKSDQWKELMKSDPHSTGEIFLTIAYYQKKVINDA